jgi:hypothetical protein
MQVKIDLVVACDVIEGILCSQYMLDEPVKLTNMEYDEMGELCAFTFEVDEEDLPRIDRGWDDESFASDMMQDAV